MRRPWLLLLLLPWAMAAEGAPAATLAPVHWKISGGPVTSMSPGTMFQVVVTAAIAPGWHVYAMDEPEGGSSATQFTVRESEGVALLSVREPKPLTAGGSLPGAGPGDGTSFYAGQASFRLHLRLTAQARRGAEVLHLSVRYQACNDRLCLPPRTAVLPLPVQVGKATATNGNIAP